MLLICSVKMYSRRECIVRFMAKNNINVIGVSI